jgi:cell division protein FtsQ
VVRSITARGDFPHRLRIDVRLSLPVAVLKSPSGRKPVTADGLLLPDVPIASALPVLTTTAALPAERVTEGAAFDLVHVVGLAPEPLRTRIKAARFKPGKGMVVKLIRGPDLIFGDATRLAAKWMAAARVLAAAGARGAAYVDVRLPERPVAGGLPTTTVVPLAPAGDQGGTTPALPAPTATAPATTAPAAGAPTATPTTTAPSTSAPAATAPAPATSPTQSTTTTATTTAPSATSGGATQAP